MKAGLKVIKYRFVAFAASGLFIIAGIVAFIVNGGFNTGIDFGSGYSEKLQISPVGLYVSYDGPESATLNVSGGNLVLQMRSSNGLESHAFPSASYPFVSDLASGLESYGVDVELVDGSLETSRLVSGFGFPMTLGPEAEHINFATASRDVTISDIRDTLSDVKGLSVQVVGDTTDGIFQIKLPVEEGMTQADAEAIVSSRLKTAYGEDDIVVMQSDFVGPKFSSQLLVSSIKAILIALALILVYITIRFRLAYAISSIIALVHDVLAMLSLIAIFQLEVSTTTIAAVLTIIGYSLNNTIVIFDRVRETVHLNKGRDVDSMIEESVDRSLTRTLITSLTTLFAIVPLAFFASGDIKLFAINLTWGILVGAYSSNYIAPALLHYFHKLSPIDVEKEKKEEEYSLVD